MVVFNDNVYATQSFCYLLDFIYQHNPNLIYKIEEPTIENNNKNLILANHSLKQLNIIDDENYRGKYSSVSKMLNECITSMGKRRFTHQFLNPVFDEEYLQNEYNIIEHLIGTNTNTNTHTENSPIVKAILNEITDMSKIMRQICLQKVSPKAIYQLFVSICASKRLYEFAKTDPYLFTYLEKKAPSCGILLDNINSISNYLQNVLNLDECKEIENVHKIEKSFIREGVDANLDLKIKLLMDSQDQLEACRCYLNSIIENYEKGTSSRGKAKTKKALIDSTDIKDDDAKSYVRIHETEKNNFSLIATDRRCKIVKEVIKTQKSAVLRYKSTFLGEETQFVLELDFQFGKQSSTNNTITTPQIDGLTKNLSTVKISLVDEVARVYQNVIKQLQNFQDELNNIIQFVTYLDLAYAKAFIAVKYNYCKPEIETETDTVKSFVKATNLRHCLIEKIQQSELYIANDICLGLNDRNKVKNQNLDGILLYGTNAVGKTSFIKSIGIAVIMAQAGLFVPASAFKFKPYKYIFTRILGNDNLFKGLSTFAVEMSEFRTILRLANENSLVLGDELCSGTENPSAVSIFVAGIQALTNAQCSFIFATHFHEVALFEEITALHSVGMKHMSVIYDKERDCLVYDRQLKDGRGTNMYGLEVCKSLSLPADFLENAYNIRMKYFAEGKTSVLEQKVSHYNAKHIAKGLCQKCGLAAAVDVHHLQHQKDANDKGFISDDKTTFDKNAAANLVNLCEACHDAIHKDTTGKKYKKTKTSKGVQIRET
jgi:DNA mismatch repair protein MutS